MADFQTIKLLHIFSKLFGITDTLYNILQSKSLDILYCCRKITDVLQQLTIRFEQHNNCEKIWDSYISEENYHGQVINDLIIEEKFAFTQLFNTIVDSICEQIESRFSSMSKLEYFHLLEKEKYAQYKESFPNEVINKLKNIYGLLFDYIRLKNELTVLYSCSEFADKPVHELVQFMKKNNLESGFQEVDKIGKLILTLPSSTASAERSFSALKRINTCYRGTQNQERLCGLSLISMEKGLLMQLKQKSTFYESVIEKFMSKERRIELIYK